MDNVPRHSQTLYGQFSNCLYPRGEPIEEQPFNGEDLANLKTTMSRIYTECSVAEYVSCDDDTAICAGLIDLCNTNWRE